MKLKGVDLLITHVRGSGPGGQHRNKRMTGVRVTHLPTGIVVTATERRSQAQNLSAALERVQEKLALLLHKDIPRVATKPSRSSAMRRVDRKKKHSRIKHTRRTSRAEWES